MRIGNDSEGPWDMIPSEDKTFTPEERATNPDLAAAAAVARQHQALMEKKAKEFRDRLNNMPSHLRREEVRTRITDYENLYEDELKNLRIANVQGRDTFMEYQCKGEKTVSYIYLTEDYKNPDYTVRIFGEPRKNVPFEHPGGTVLLKINMSDGSIEEIHRWKEEDE